MKGRYFTRAIPGVLTKRYFVMHDTRNEYVRVQVSCPDGKEIREPTGVTDGRNTAQAKPQARVPWSTFSFTQPKTCRACKKDKPISEYDKGRGRYGVRPHCKACRAQARKAAA